MSRKITVRIFMITLLLVMFGVELIQAQTVADLQKTIEQHYVAINSNDGAVIRSAIERDHLEGMTIFDWDGSMLANLDDLFEGVEKSGMKLEDMATVQNLYVRDFKAKIFDNVGVATFYLTGARKQDETTMRGTWRVTAVWVFQNGKWKEVHHHESVLAGSK